MQQIKFFSKQSKQSKLLQRETGGLPTLAETENHFNLPQSSEKIVRLSLSNEEADHYKSFYKDRVQHPLYGYPEDANALQ
ncbi:hypothetical protein FBEOM_1990 [Fusarium beomiforme]|uniref:Uncharacterized protein n=1 Tax=Fusarium beomiforme TaxID=44412 RepID=A0A9P5E495_9HYPO|nr:hypothetical protein FBEOM_1990 [Fusarium beomiforme]